jgi:hypothetical protein
MAELTGFEFFLWWKWFIFVSNLNKCFQIQACKKHHFISVPNLIPPAAAISH